MQRLGERSAADDGVGRKVLGRHVLGGGVDVFGLDGGDEGLVGSGMLVGGVGCAPAAD